MWRMRLLLSWFNPNRNSAMVCSSSARDIADDDSEQHPADSKDGYFVYASITPLCILGCHVSVRVAYLT